MVMNPYNNPGGGQRPVKPPSFDPLPDEFATQPNRQQPYQQFQQQPAANTMPHVPYQGIPINPKPTIPQDEDSRQSSMSEGLMNAINVNQYAYAGSGASSNVPSARQSQQPLMPSPPHQQPTGRQYYSLVPGSDQPQLLHDYRPASAEDEVDPVTGKIKAMPTGVSGGKIYVCMGYGDCAKTFTRSEHLARHIRYVVLCVIRLSLTHYRSIGSTLARDHSHVIVAERFHVWTISVNTSLLVMLKSLPPINGPLRPSGKFMRTCLSRLFEIKSERGR
jgi:hypothetical protein